MRARPSDPTSEAKVSDPWGPQPASRRSEREIARRASGQHGAITLAQLDDLGLGARGASHRVDAGRLSRVHRGVYAVGVPRRETRWAGAVATVGSGAVLSHRSAAALWGLLRDDPAPVHLTLPGQSTRRRHRTIEIHSGTSLIDADLAVHDDIPCTTVPRTLLDCATEIGRRGLERAIDRSEELRLFDLTAVAELLARNRGRRGAGLLATVLADYAGPTATQSHAEELLLAAVRDRGLPAPEINTWIPLDDGGFRPDFLWREPGLVVEVDGRTYHARQRAFRHDRVRDRRLALAGFETRRYAASEVIDNRVNVAREIGASLTAGSRPRPKGRFLDPTGLKPALRSQGGR